MRRIKVNDSLSVELSDAQHIRIVREGGGLVLIHMGEAKQLINALAYLATRANGDADKDGEAT